ncbi:MAG: Adenylate cyclase 1 [Pelotomaculum sp. PtaU1.Bin065]|nr:MAG: Adenylate cyclase 1 [Pelotomaculum sp. PtaU1.Bin065]
MLKEGEAMRGRVEKLKGKSVAIVLVVLVLVTSLAGAWEGLELSIYDSWFKLRGARPAPDDIVVVAIDDRSIGEIGLLPWQRQVYARLLEKLKDAKVVCFDVVFDTPGTPEDNAALAAAAKAQGRVVMANMFSFEQNAGEVYQVPRFPVKQLASATAGIGFANVPQDLDSVIRRVTTVDTNTFGRPFPCLSLATLLTEKGLNPNSLKLAGNGVLYAGDLAVPIDDKYQTLINFWGPASTFQTYSFTDILNDRVSGDKLAGKSVFVGFTSASEHDYVTTPFTLGNMVLGGALPSPGVEVHASALATYHSEGFYRRAPLAVNLAVLLLVGALSVAGVARAKSPLRGLLYLLAIMTAAGLGVYLCWCYGRYWVNLATPVGLGMLVYTGMTAENLVRTELDRRRTRALFARYVPPAVVSDLLQHPEDIVLGGMRVELTIFFSDVRGFTSFSEDKTPEYVVQRLNEYFTEMNAIIFKHGGTLDKYMGDGIMAFFGAPIHYEDHADRALAASLEMLERLKELNKKWEEQGEPLFNIGVGINSGPVVVGNVGSPERMDYTIMGGEVNLASRLESMNKEYKTNIILSDRTLKYLKNKDELPGEITLLGETSVRGMVEKVLIYTVKAGKASEG